MTKLNDYELLYLYSWHDEVALQILIKKYMNYIRSKLDAFRICREHYEDFFQDCLVTLYEAIRSFDDNKNVKFSTYFTVLMERKIMKLLYSNVQHYSHIVFMDSMFREIPDEYDLEKNFYYERKINEIQEIKINELMKKIYNDIFIRKVDISEFANENQIDCRVVYNQIHHLRKIIRNKIDDVK